MKKYINSYHVFLASTMEKSLMYVVYPLGIGLLSALIGIVLRGAMEWVHMPDTMVTACTIGGIVIVSEILLDILVFGGILCKNTNKLEYLKTSKRGMEVLKKGLIVDKVRRILMMGGYLLVGYAFCHVGGSIWQLLSFVILAATIVECGLMVTRWNPSMILLFLMLLVTNILGNIVCILVFRLPGFCFFLFVVLYGMIAMESHKVAIIRAKKSFCDEIYE